VPTAACDQVNVDPGWATPLLVYSEAELQRLYAAIPPTLQVHFALKSCYRLPVLRCLKQLGAGAEVMSPLEWDLAVAAGWSGPEIVVNGLGRSSEFLHTACAAGSLIVLDCEDDLERLLGVVGERRARVGVRLRPSLEEKRPYAIPSKLGSGDDLLERCRGDARLELCAVHVHAASQETDPDFYAELVRQLRRYAVPLIDIGGGFDTEFDFHRLPFEGVIVEPGRYLVNSAGFVLTTVVAVKGDYVVVDAASSTLMPHKEASYVPLRQGGYVCTLVDGITSLSSVLIRECRLPRRPEVGERIVLRNCGAYTSAMAQFWAHPPMPVAFLTKDGEFRWDLDPATLRRCRRELLGC
jgi:diaminopimelate decarboxylase